MAVVEIDGNPINVILSDTMPLGMPEHIVANADDSYTVFLNARLSYEAQKEGFQHAIKHIRDNDYEKYDVQEIEMHAHGLREPEIQKGTMNIVIPWWIVDAILQLAWEEEQRKSQDEWIFDGWFDRTRNWERFL